MGTQPQRQSSPVTTERPDRRSRGSFVGGDRPLAHQASESATPPPASLDESLPAPLISIPRLAKGVASPGTQSDDGTIELETNNSPPVTHSDLNPSIDPRSLTKPPVPPRVAGQAAATSTQSSSFEVVNYRILDEINLEVRSVESGATPAVANGLDKYDSPSADQAVQAPASTPSLPTHTGPTLAGTTTTGPTTTGPTTTGATTTGATTTGATPTAPQVTAPPIAMPHQASTSEPIAALSQTSTPDSSLPSSETMEGQDGSATRMESAPDETTLRGTPFERSMPALGRKLTKRQRMVAEILFQVGLTVVLVGLLLLAHALLTGRFSGSRGETADQPETKGSADLPASPLPQGRVTGIQPDVDANSRVIQAHFESDEEIKEHYPPHLYAGQAISDQPTTNRFVRSEANSSVYLAPATGGEQQGGSLIPAQR